MSVNDAGPLEFLDLYLTDQIMEHIVLETNLYAEQYIASNADSMSEHSNARSWEETTVNEMKTFIGLILLMGVIYKPRLHLYWSTDELYNSPM